LGDYVADPAIDVSADMNMDDILAEIKKEGDK